MERKWGFVEFPLLEHVSSRLKPRENRHLQKLIVQHLSAIQAALENYFPFILTSGVEWAPALNAVSERIGPCFHGNITIYPHICRNNYKTQVIPHSFRLIWM